MVKCVCCKTSFAPLDEFERWVWKWSGMCLKCYEAKAEEWAKDILNTFAAEVRQ